MNNNEIKMETATWDSIEEGYVKLDREKAKLIMIIDWKLEYIQKFRDEKMTKELGREVLKKQIEFSATVISEDGKPAQKVFTTTSINALKGLKDVLKNKKNTSPILLRIKKMGEGKTTFYDIEEQEIKKP